MTTIAYDGQLLCADSQATCNYKIQRVVQKIFKVDDAESDFVAIAFTGVLGDADHIIAAIRAGCNNISEMTRNDFAAIAIDRKGDVWMFDSGAKGRIKAGDFEARGSGSDFAMGAMGAGTSAYKAVAIACRLDELSGGEVQCYDIKTTQLTGPFR